MVGSLGEFVLCDLALSLGRSQRQSLSMLITDRCSIELNTAHRAICCSNACKDRSTASLPAYSSYIATQ